MKEYKRHRGSLVFFLVEKSLVYLRNFHVQMNRDDFNLRRWMVGFIF